MFLKKMIFVLTIIFCVIIVNNTASSQCDLGWSYIEEQIYISPCLYNVGICFKCTGTSPYGEVKVVSVAKDDVYCNNPMNFEDILAEINEIIESQQFITSHLCPQTAPPCDQPPYGKIEWYSRPVCWQKYMRTDSIIEYRMCQGSSQCITKWRVCWDAATGTSIRTLLEGPVLDTPINCPVGEEPPDPEEIGVWSDCFRVSTLCD